MKKVSLSLLLLLAWGYAHAQIAQWVIPPMYDHMDFVSGSSFIVADSANAKVFFNQDGQRLFSTTEHVHPYSGGYAVVTNDSSNVLGFYDKKGHLTLLDDQSYKVANDYPFFSEGYLIIKKKRYYFMDPLGVVERAKHLRVFPFHNGYASCRYFENPKKKKGTVNYLVDTYKKEVPMIYKGRAYDASEIAFVSSVNDENIAFVVIKDNIFVFDGNTKLLTPLYFPNSNSKHPTQAKLQEDLPEAYDAFPNALYARCGKGEQITIHFDSHMVPTDIYYNNEKYQYKENKKEAPKRSSAMQAFEDQQLFGLSKNGKTLIPAQFDAIDCCFGDLAFAKQSGKYGLMKVVEEAQLTPSINEDKVVAFRHQWFNTTIRIDMPSTLNPSKIDLVDTPDLGYIVDKISKQTKTSDYGNRAEYACRLAIPSTVTKDITEYNYLIQMSYDNIKLIPYSKKVKAWHYDCYDVTIHDKEKTYDKKSGLLTFPFTISTECVSDEVTALFEVAITPDYYEADLQQTSTTQALCTIPVSALEEGENDLTIVITEEGCPSVSFPVTISFKKPKSKQKQPTKDSFVISKAAPLNNNEQ